MKLVNFKVSDQLADHIDRIIDEWGFTTKSEFFRFLLLQFIEKNQGRVPTRGNVDDFTREASLLRSRRDKMSPMIPNPKIY